MKSPIRYPGGKTSAIQILMQYVGINTKRAISPFMGGGSFEIAMAHSGIKVVASDIFDPLVNFWQCCLDDSTKLSKLAEKHYPLTLDGFNALKLQYSILSNWEKAAAYYAINRSSYGGLAFSGGYSITASRFTRSAIRYLSRFRSPNLIVKKSGFESPILNAKFTDFIYCDPPYDLPNANLYGVRGNLQDFDHAGLAECLKTKNNWILTYNDTPLIRKLYSNYKSFRPSWQYALTKRDSNELFILSHDLAESGCWFK